MLHLSALVYDVDLLLYVATVGAAVGAAVCGNFSDVASGNGESLISGEQFIAFIRCCVYIFESRVLASAKLVLGNSDCAENVTPVV